MTNKNDDLDAVRAIVQALEGFNKDEQTRIIRWAMEKAGIVASNIQQPTPSAAMPNPTSREGKENQPTTDIKSFITQKDPKNDLHFVAAVAYYHQFQAPDDQRKEEIGAEDLQEACRLTNRSRLSSPIKTLRNALNAGLINKGSRGKFTLNTVGENLVAMSLPLNSKTPATTKKRRKSKPKNKKRKHKK